MISKGDLVKFRGETVKVIVTPNMTHTQDPKMYLVEGYSGGWYYYGNEVSGAYGLTRYNTAAPVKYWWAPREHLTPIEPATIELPRTPYTPVPPAPVAATTSSKYRVGDWVMYEGQKALIAKDFGGGVYTIQRFDGQGWSVDSHIDLVRHNKYWNVDETQLTPLRTRASEFDGIQLHSKYIWPSFAEKNPPKIETKRTVDTYIQQPVKLTKRKTKHTLKIV